MKIGILKSDGTPVYIDTFSEIRYDINGFITSFKVEQTFRYYQNNDFKSVDRYLDNLDGYYREDKYIAYIQSLTSSSNRTSIVELLSTYKFNFQNIQAKVGDPVTVKVVDYGSPYEVFYNQKEYTFNLESTADNQGVKSYKKALYENLQIVDYAIDVPATASGTTINNDLSTTPNGYFYEKNFGNNVNNWTISDTDKTRFKKLATLIAFRINYLIIDIFPNLISANDNATLEGVANSSSSDISDLPEILQAIFLLKKSWGYYYSPNADPSLVNRTSFDAIFSANPDYDEYNYYYTGLVTFYNRCYKIPEKLILLPDNTKLGYLFRVVPISVVSIFPFSIILNVLTAVSKTRILTDNDQELIVRLVSSIAVPNVDTFLDFLLTKTIDATKTNFETIYNVLSDARLDRIPFINWVANDQTYRKYFNFAVYNLWLQSKYNFQYFPPGTPLARTNPNAFFNQNPDQFNGNNILSFSTFDSGNDTNTPITTTIKFTSKFVDTKINVSLINETTQFLFTNTGDDSYSQTTNSNEKFFGVFHFYQPISLAGFKANLDFDIPQKTLLPAFLFHYVEEYGRLADFDAAIALAINLTSDILFFYFTGGLNALADLEYLMELSQIGKALTGGLPETAEVLVWRGLGAGSEVFNMTALSLTNVQDYLISTATTDNDKAILQKSRLFVLGLLILSAGVSALAQTQAVKAANEILDLIDAGTSLNVPQGFISLLEHLGIDRGAVLATFESKLSTLFDSSVTNNIYTKYTSFTDSQKLVFWRDFKDIDNDTWKILNQVGGYSIDNWITLYQANIKEAEVVDFVISQDRVDRILKFYTSPQIRNTLEAYSYNQRIAFLDSPIGSVATNSSIFVNLQNTPMGIELVLNALFETRVGLDVYDINDVEQILTIGLDDGHIGTLIERNKLYNFTNTQNSFVQNITVLEVSDLKDLYNSYTDQINESTALKDYLRSNRLFVSTQIFNDDIPVGNAIEENFISGKNDIVVNILNNATEKMRNDFIEFDNERFRAFKLKAYDNSNPPADRSLDTEMKYVFNFLENHYQFGNRFVIDMQSTLYTCPNCQRYLQSILNFAQKDGKNIEFTFRANPAAFGMKDVKLLIQ